MARLPLNTLPVFRAVAEAGNLRAAAQTLHLSHSAVSQQIRHLEALLGLRLFERAGRGIQLNEAGRALLARVAPALALLDEGVHAAHEAAAGESVRLRVSSLPSFAQRWLLPRMGRWRERHPEVLLEVETSQQLADLPREGFHAALRYGRGQWPGLVSEALFPSPMPMVLVGSPEAAQRLAGAEPPQIAREPLLGEQALWEAWFREAGYPVKVVPVAVFNDGGMLLQAVEQGMGLSLVRELLAADALDQGKLVKLSPLSIPYEGGHTYHLVYRPELADWPPLLALRAWLLSEIALAARRLDGHGPA